MRKAPFVRGEFYHVFNRGVDKRDIFMNKYDAFRFIESMEKFNVIDPIGSITEFKRRIKDKNRLSDSRPNEKLVNIICYCLNPNHYHFILEQLVDGGISEFMKRLSSGYTQTFNLKYKRSGVLFQGKFKAVHIESNEQLLYVSSYVNLNNKVHKKFDGTKKHFLDSISNRSSWNEYIEKTSKHSICKKDIILGQLDSKKDYKTMSEKVVEEIKEKRYED